MRPNFIVILAAIAAFFLKFWCASETIGTTDTLLFCQFGQIINDDGLVHTYRTSELFNHTPLVGTYAAFCDRVDRTEREQLRWLPLLIRLPGIIADFLAILVLFRIRTLTGRPPWWALGLFALSPVAFMVSGYHGNVDSVLALMLLVTAWMCVEKKPVLCGIALGLACQIKVIPLLLAPVFFAHWIPRKKWLHFAIAAGVVILIGWAPALGEARGVFLSRVLGYSGFWGAWGISYTLRTVSGLRAFSGIGMTNLSPEQNAVMACSKYLIISFVLLLAWQRRKADATGLIQTLSLVWAIFFVFATGVAPQYFVWLAPFVLLATPRWYAAITAAVSVFLVAFYSTISTGAPWTFRPWVLGLSQNEYVPIWGPYLYLPWLTLIVYLVWLVWLFRQPATDPLATAGEL